MAKYTVLHVKIKLDGSGFGAFSTPERAALDLQNLLDDRIPHYEPLVTNPATDSIECRQPEEPKITRLSEAKHSSVKRPSLPEYPTPMEEKGWY